MASNWQAHRLSSAFLRHIQSLEPPAFPLVTGIDQDLVGGAGLWLRSEPGENRDQADALAAAVAIGTKA